MHRILQVLFKRAVHRILRVRVPRVTGTSLQPRIFILVTFGCSFGDVDLAHVDFTLDAHQRAGRRQRHAVLARTRFGQHLGLAHVFGQQRFAQAVVDLVRAGVVQVFALEMDVRAALALRRRRA